MKTIPPLLLALLAPFAVAEDKPATTPPATPPATTTPPGDGTTPPEPGKEPAKEPAKDPAASGVKLIPGPGAGGRIVPKGTGPTDDPFGFSLTLGAGYDSNVLLLPDDNPGVDSADSTVLSADARLLWRAINTSATKVTLVGAAEYNHFPNVDDQDLLRYGVLGTALFRWQGLDPGFAAGINRFVVDQETEATVINGMASLNYIDQARWVHIPAIEAYHFDYNNNDDATGTMLDAHYRLWWLLKPGKAANRLEGGLRVGRYFAHGDAETYFSIRPALGIVYRLGEAATLGTWDFTGRVQYDYRQYEAAGGGYSGGEKLNVFVINGSADIWLHRSISAGVYVRYTINQSDIDTNDYERLQAGLRTTVSF